MGQRQSVLSLIILISATAFAGNPGTLFLQEGFNGMVLPPGWTHVRLLGSQAAWNVVGQGTNPPIAPYAGTGQAKFNSYDAPPGEQARLVSPRIDLGTSSDPFLTFHVYHDDEYFSSFDSVYVEASITDSVNGPWIILAAARRSRTEIGWETEVVSLFSYAGTSSLFLSWRGVSDYGNNMYVDEIRVADSSFHDLGIPTIFQTGDAPIGNTPNLRENYSRIAVCKQGITSALREDPMMFAGSSPLNLTAVVQNFGTFVEATYQLEWMIDGQIQPAIVNSQPLQRNDQDTLTLSWPAPSLGTHTIVAWTLLASDSNQTNDSLRTTIVILDTSVVYVEGFNTPTFPPPGWTAINRDGGLLPPWFLGNSSSIFPPYEGLGFAGNNFQRANGNCIDDYLISPPIPGIGQSGYLDSLKFWVRSPTNPPPTSNYPDSLMVLLSTTGTDTTDFNIFIDYFSVPKTGWELRRYPLSELVPSNSTVYVALRYLHYNGGESGSNSDFVGVDFLHVTHNLPTSTTGSSAVPMLFNLAQNYPNPFNPTSQITFSVPTRSATKLVLYDQLGQEVRILFEGEAEPGRTYRSTIDGARLASGVYFYALTSGGLSAAKKALLVK